MHIYKQYFYFISISLISNIIHAEDTSFELGELVVSGEQARVVEQVGTVDVVTAEDIKLSGARNLNEAIDLLPGLYVRTGGDGTPRIDIRGLRTRQVTLLLDGVPINSSIDGQFDPSAIDVANIDRIKVTRGAGSLLYGTGGSAGVINIITKAGSAGQLKSHAKAELGNNGTKLGQISAGGGGESWQGFVSASHYDRNSYRLSHDYIPVTVTGGTAPNNFQATGDRINSDRDDTNLYTNLIWQVLEKTEVGLSSSYRAGNYGKPPEIRDTSGGDKDPFAGGNAKFERVDHYEGYSFNLTGSHELNIPLSIKPTMYFNRLDELTNNYDSANFNTQTRNRASNTEARSDILGAGLLLSYDFNRLGKSSIAGDCKHEKWEADGFQVDNTNTAIPFSITEHDTICSVAFEHETRVFNNLGLVGGVGTAHQTKKSGDGDSGDTYLIGASYDFPTNTQLHLSHAKKIRFPTLRDLFEPGRANPNLVKETTFHYEAGIEQTFSIIPATVGVTVFRIDADDFIEKDSVTKLAQNIEADRFQGIEVTTDIKPVQGLALRANYTFMESENRSPYTVNRDLQNRPKHRFNLDVTFDIPYVDVDLYGSWSHVEDSLEQDSTGLISQEIDEYDLVDLKIQKDVVDYLSVYGRAMNLLDEDYAESGGFPSPGRTVLFGIEMNYGS